MTHLTSRRIAASLILSAAVAGFTGCSKTQTAESLVAEARQYQQKGDNKAAIIQLKNALQKSPDNVDARFLLGQVYLASGDALSAQKELEKAVSLGMPADKVALAMGMSFVQQGQYQKALDAMPLPATGQPAPELLTQRGLALLSLGNNPAAKDAFDLALKAKPGSPDVLLGLARHSMAVKAPSDAMRYIDQVLAANPSNTEALLFKGDQLLTIGKPDEALAVFDQALKIKPDLIAALISKANIEISTKKFDAAKVDLDAARKVAPSALVVPYTQAQLDFAQGKNAAALESLQLVLKSAPDHMPTLLLFGAVQAALGANEQAEQAIRKYLDANPTNVYARKLLASVLSKSGQSDRALGVLTGAKEAQNDPQLLMLAGETYMRTKEYSKATEYFERANKIAPETAMVHTALAMSSLGQGENAKAISELELASNLNPKTDATPTNPTILLVMTRLRLNQFSEALTLLKTLEKNQPNNPLVFNLEGGAYMGMKNIPEARASFMKAIAIEPTFIPAVQNLAQLDLQDKKPDDAKKRFLTVLEKDKKNIPAMVALAQFAGRTGKPEEATTWLEKAVAENPAALAPAILLGNQYLRTGKKEPALTLAQKLLTTNAGNADVLDLLAQAQFANGDKAAALATYAKVIAAAPKSPLAQLRVASIHMALDDPKSAVEALKKAVELKPDFLEAQLSLSTLYVRQGNLDGALKVASEIQKQRPKEAVGYALEGDVLQVQKKFGPAVTAFEKAIAIAKTPELMIKLHESMNIAGRGKDADVRLAKWLQERPTDMKTLEYQANVLLARKANKPAIAAFEKVLQTAPNNPVVLNNLAFAYQLEKDPRAVATAEKAMQVTPEAPAVIDTLGWILVEQGDTTRGVPLLQKAVTLAQKSNMPKAITGQIQLHLAKGMIKAGDKAGARKQLEEVISSGAAAAEVDGAQALLKTL